MATISEICATSSSAATRGQHVLAEGGGRGQHVADSPPAALTTASAARFSAVWSAKAAASATSTLATPATLARRLNRRRRTSPATST
jgi:hypothetical protein